MHQIFSAENDFNNLQIDIHQLIVCMTTLVDAKSNNTAMHSKRVADMALKFCQIVKLDELQTEEIHIGAHLHDIGKIGVPDSILLKNGKLSDTEWTELKKHSEVGANVLTPVTGFTNVAKYVRHHHERYDGLGYPDKLIGEKIPYGARVIAVCDSIDAMLSNRCYRNAMDIDYCYNEIKNNLGKMYDPTIGKIILENWDTILAARKS